MAREARRVDCIICLRFICVPLSSRGKPHTSLDKETLYDHRMCVARPCIADRNHANRVAGGPSGQREPKVPANGEVGENETQCEGGDRTACNKKIKPWCSAARLRHAPIFR